MRIYVEGQQMEEGRRGGDAMHLPGTCIGGWHSLTK